MTEMKANITAMIKKEAITEEEIQKQLKDFDKYARYDFQDIAEITANKILKREYKHQNLDFLFLTTFEDLLTAGEEIVYCGVLGGDPVMRRVNPQNLYTLGGNSMYIEDSDIIVEYNYMSVGQIIDDYWDELSDKDIEFLETGTLSSTSSSAIGLNRDISINDYYGEEQAFEIFHPNEMGTRTFAGSFDTYGNVRIVKSCWRSRRKIGELKYYDEEGTEQKSYVPEDYVPDKDLGEEVKWIWVNEWLEATKIADDIYVNMRPVPFAGKSLTNKSKGTPPYIGSVNSTNGYRVQSLMDIIKPLSYSYDIAYYKRELEIATYKGSFAAINSAMVPSGWEPEQWMRYVTVNKFGWLDPTNEILKGPSQGKSAGAFNTLTATNVQIGDPSAIQMYTKFLECCKFAYKKNPKRGQYLLDDMGMEMITQFTEFSSAEMDIYIANGNEDTKLYDKLEANFQAAIQTGQAKIADMYAISSSESIQEIGRKLQDSAAELADEQKQKEQLDRESAEKMQKAAIEAQEKEAKREDFNKQEDRNVKYAEIESKEKLAVLNETGNNLRDNNTRIDTDKNGIDDRLDLERTENDRVNKESRLELGKEELDERIRSNLANEEIRRSAVNKSI